MIQRCLPFLRYWFCCHNFKITDPQERAQLEVKLANWFVTATYSLEGDAL